ncbi:FtsW/RodA/SpoVE family cell cycle protein [Ligilactobacillus sp. WILCCON 0076]|uniref:Probable peptidoglycan glycosyltransferase FtsW n=1 Tax=Ligilactobacillus ubinensis TaxID=2876789 RepID=A0A9X2FKJ6_9LACO|nr:FtsW/RodA/SpoVE family cell cycle protein [Ligilactobacillus ubinensis]MCP0886461.1 FtsW/RodA/SpoVE family cell cycle protein [Ligilactobacillus ubinensis]
MEDLKRKLKYFDYFLFLPYVALCIIGVIMVYSASSINQTYSGGSSNSYLYKQLVFVFIGLILFFLAAHINPRYWVNDYVISIGFIAVFLALVYAKYFTKAINGANGWISLGIISIQPSEICKLYITIWLARLFARQETTNSLIDRNYTQKNIIVIIKLCMLFGLIIITPDLGGLVINGAIVMIMWLAANKWSGKAKISALVGSITVFYAGLNIFRFFNPFSGKLAYVYQRFVAFFAPFKVASSSGKQLVNSYYAISNGGLFGRGLGNSIQKRGYLPEPYTDFILSIIVEELGFIGLAIVLVLLMWLTLRIILIGIRSKNTYNSLFCYGIGTFMFVETALNVGAVCGLLPITGVTLPFISYGGSSMVVLSLALGMVVNISVSQRRNAEFDLLARKVRH